jgi:L-lactate utilization protein LutB
VLSHRFINKDKGLDLVPFSKLLCFNCSTCLTAGALHAGGGRLKGPSVRGPAGVRPSPLKLGGNSKTDTLCSSHNSSREDVAREADQVKLSVH